LDGKAEFLYTVDSPQLSGIIPLVLPRPLYQLVTISGNRQARRGRKDRGEIARWEFGCIYIVSAGRWNECLARNEVICVCWCTLIIMMMMMV